MDNRNNNSHNHIKSSHHRNKRSTQSGISTNTKNISHNHRNNRHSSYKKVIIQRNNIFHKTHHNTINKLRHRQMKETMLYVVWRRQTMTRILISDYTPAHPGKR